MDKKNALWVCCDIQGTYELDKDTTFKDHETCFRLVDEIRKERECDVAIFTFLSAEDSDYVGEFFYGTSELVGAYDIVKHLNSHYGTRIIFGPQIGGKDYFYANHDAINYDYPTISKAEKILYHDKVLRNSGYDILETIYIDDKPNINIPLLLMNKDIIDRIVNTNYQLTTIENHLQSASFCKKQTDLLLINSYDESDGIIQKNIMYVNYGLKMRLNDIKQYNKSYQKIKANNN